MIKIDMEMPESCLTCPLKQHYITHKWNYRCGKTKAVFNSNIKIRHPDCPLIEVENKFNGLDDNFIKKLGDFIGVGKTYHESSHVHHLQGDAVDVLLKQEGEEISETKICETCKYTELNGIEYPCCNCSEVYNNLGESKWELAGCEFCRGEKEIGDEDTNMSICKSKTTGENYIVFYAASDYGDWTEWNHKINYCPMCGKRLTDD